jgi:hypothetical protein
MIRPVTFMNEGEQIVGILHVPDGLRESECAPAVVMFHGFTGNKSEAHRLFVHVARALCEAGYVVLRFDFRGSGDSDGDFEEMTVPREVSDAVRSLDFISDVEGVDPKRIGILGLSMGGRVASILASKDRRVKFVILYSAALTPLKEKFLGGLGKGDLARLERGEPVHIGNGWYLKRTFFETVDSVVPLDVLNRIRVPVLLVHGDSDGVVPLEGAEKGYEILRGLNGKNELYVVKGGDHVFTRKEHTKEVIEKTLSWLSSLW